MFLTIYIHQFGWISERRGGFFKFASEGHPERGGLPQKRGGSNPGGNYESLQKDFTIDRQGEC